MLIQLSRSK